MPASEADKELVARIRNGDAQAWEECIALYEGRLQAFARNRLGNHATAEDVVQEAFLGFLTALPNFDENTPLDTFLFAITAHKLTDVLRRNGRRPTLPLMVDSSATPLDPEGPARVASSIARSQERHLAEECVIANCLEQLIAQWQEKGEFERLKCIELILVKGLSNKATAEALNLSEQAVANHKYFVVSKLREAGKDAKVRDFQLENFGLTED